MLEDDAEAFVSETVLRIGRKWQMRQKVQRVRREKVDQFSSSAAIRMRAAILRTSAVIAAQGGDFKGRMVSMNEFSEETKAAIDFVYTHLKELASILVEFLKLLSYHLQSLGGRGDSVAHKVID